MSTMNTGIRGSVTAMMTAESQSWAATTASTVSGHDHGQDELRQVPGEVAVEGVDTPAWPGSRARRCAGRRARTGRRRGDPLRERRPQLGLDPGRAAIGGHVAVPGDRRTHHDDGEQRHQRAAAAARGPSRRPRPRRRSPPAARPGPRPGPRSPAPRTTDSTRYPRAARPWWSSLGSTGPLTRRSPCSWCRGLLGGVGDAGSAVQPRPRPPPGPCSASVPSAASSVVGDDRGPAAGRTLMCRRPRPVGPHPGGRSCRTTAPVASPLPSCSGSS